jgi:hypothetical protein
MNPWPSKAPTKTSLDRMIQIQYYLVDEGNQEVFTVMAKNLWSGSAYHWRKVPYILVPILQQLIWRQWAMAFLYMEGCKNVNLKKYLRYTEVVLDTVWSLALISPNISEIPMILTMWMTIDCLVGRHSSERIEEWQEREKRKISDASVTLDQWISSLSRFPCQAVMEGYDFIWFNLPWQVRRWCLGKIEGWVEGEWEEVSQKRQEREIENQVEMVSSEEDEQVKLKGKERKKEKGQEKAAEKKKGESRAGKRKKQIDKRKKTNLVEKETKEEQTFDHLGAGPSGMSTSLQVSSSPGPIRTQYYNSPLTSEELNKLCPSPFIPSTKVLSPILSQHELGQLSSSSVSLPLTPILSSPSLPIPLMRKYGGSGSESGESFLYIIGPSY